MKQFMVLLFSAAVALPAARAAGSPESLMSAGLAGFGQLVQFRPKAFKAQRKVRVSGSVTLRGTAWVQDDAAYVVAALLGSAKVSGENGRVRGDENVSQTATFYLYSHQAVVSQKVDFDQKIRLYCDGEYAGTAQIGGTILVKGIRNGSDLILSGSQAVEGEVLVDCPARP